MADRVVDMDRPPPTDDILHPLASLKWSECGTLPVGLSDAQAVWLEDKLYVGGGVTTGSNDKLYIYTPSTDTWGEMDTPVYWFALITYHSQLTLVGGWVHGNDSVTNKLLTLTSHDQWREILPPMTVKRCSASAVEYAKNIIVAGGGDDQLRYTDIVEVYNGHHWTKAQCLPKPCERMKSTVLSGHWYLMGGSGQGKEVYCTSLASLVASCQLSEKSLPSVWKRRTDVPHVLSSPAVFGNRLIAVGGHPLTSSIHAYSPHNQSWIHVGDMPVKLCSTCTIVLPAGRLMVIGGASEATLWESYVYQATLNVPSLEPDGQFSMEALSQLKRIGITIFNTLEDYKQPLQSVIGIEIVNLPTDLTSFFILSTWLQGHASLRPTWRHFIWTLREIHLSHLADQIESCLSGVSIEQTLSSNLGPSQESEEPESKEEEHKGEEGYVMDMEEEKHIVAVQKAMQEKGMLDHTILHGVFVGPARSGKNSIMERLLGRMPSYVSPSTGVAESVVHVKVIQKSTTLAANVMKSIWSEMDYDDEAIKLMLINRDHQGKIEIPVIQNQIKQETLICAETVATETVQSNENVNDIVKTSDPDDVLIESQPMSAEVQPKLSASSTPILPKSYVPPIEIVKIALRHKGRKGVEILQQHFLKTWSLYLTNTGGQMEFQEVLPLLVSGPSMFFFTFRLDRDLNKTYSIEYDFCDGTHAKPYVSTLTTLEGILQTLATISAMGTFVYRGLLKGEVPLVPKVFLIGTHKDRLDSRKASDHIAKVDQKLQEVIKSTSHYEQLVEFAYPSQLIFTVNNFSEDDSDFCDIRSAVERVIIREEFQMTSPAHWLIFSLALRKLKQYVISYNQCLDIANQCGVDENELGEALHFIHSKMGLIRYFQYEDIKHLVVIHPQYLFDKVTELIVDTFTFEKAGKQKMDDFKQKGIFSLAEFEKISSRTDASISAFEFAKLLEKLRIAAPFQIKRTVMYFFPCVLAHTPKQSVVSKLRSLMISSSLPSLIVTFECGYCPKGLAGALVSYLMANEMNSNFSWKLCHDEIFRNQVSFRVGPLDTVVLNICSTHISVTLLYKKFQSRTVTCPLQEICSAVYHAVDSGITQINSDINYVSAQHLFTFSCGCKENHPGLPEFVGNTLHNLVCSKTNEVFPLPKHHELWPISKPDYQDQTRYAQHMLHKLEKPVENAKQGEDKTFSGSVQLGMELTTLTENHHSVLLKQLTKHAAAWREIGTYLRFTQGQLDNIQANAFLLTNSPTSWLSKMLAEWLQWAPGDSRGSTRFATLESLKSALNEAGFCATAHDLGV